MVHLDPDSQDFIVDMQHPGPAQDVINRKFNSKSLAAINKLGGPSGIDRALRKSNGTDLSPGGCQIDGDMAPPWNRTMGLYEHYQSRPTDRNRLYEDSRVPRKNGGSFLKFLLITCNDKALILLTIAVMISLGIALYQKLTGKHPVADISTTWIESVSIIVAVTVVVLVGAVNDWQKERQFSRDKSVKVTRAGRMIKISALNILEGEILHIKQADVVPVSGLLIQGKDVSCDESQAMGGVDVRKVPTEMVLTEEKAAAEDSFVESGTRVTKGEGTLLCTEMGVHSSYGKTLISLNEDRELTPLQSKLNNIAERIAKLGGTVGLVLFIILLVRFCTKLPQNTATASTKGRELLDILIVVSWLFRGGLPLALTLSFAFATTRMLKKNILVRHLKACEAMGNVTTICSDKTDTLTQNKTAVVAGVVGTQRRFKGFPGAATGKAAQECTPQELASGLAKDTQDLLLKSIALNSTASDGNVNGVYTFIGSKIDKALIMFAREFLAMGSVSEERANVKILQHIPFDSSRMCMDVVTQLEYGKARLYVKGASEIILSKCTQLLKRPDQDISNGPIQACDEDGINRLIEEYCSHSLKTIVLAYRDFESWPPQAARRSEDNKSEALFEDVFKNMCFIGLVGIQDPLRPGVPEAVRECQSAGVVVRMITGDNKLTAGAIAKQCGILHDEGIMMEGTEFRKLDKDQQNEIIPRLHVLARSSPEDKRILVRRLEDLGKTVAVTGYVTNDAPALEPADVGLSMGIAGTDIAKQASSIMLMDDNFTSIVKALKWSRAVKDAVKRFLQFHLTITIVVAVLVFSTAVVSARQQSLFTAVQLLWLKLIMDTLAALALATGPPQKSVLDRSPDRRDSGIISPAMWNMIIGQAIYQLAVTFALYYTATQLAIAEEQEYMQAIVFNTFVWMQIFNLWNNRRSDDKLNIFEGLTRHWFFIGINIILCGGQVLIIFFGGTPFSISTASERRPPQSGLQWSIAPFWVVCRPSAVERHILANYGIKWWHEQVADDVVVWSRSRL
ncbi:uncharacterized protein B0I36DRAFT_378686 [Microdochium trichocladiopsis]|uniref:Calcium-transporting ATPase n=1 Tax=Microdochium trichocladiopsis TaxID=1682393 RepID=A0A9P9BGX1_9PEZI|nr:uncharacterized protein B0I36DRAFT_378686 [Microdochium trichocladiopsis]KAH7007947.1 hypothetical protein B0I36DRAFT_378686 [Microdochium trichocladiopsis]